MPTIPIEPFPLTVRSGLPALALACVLGLAGCRSAAPAATVPPTIPPATAEATLTLAPSTPPGWFEDRQELDPGLVEPIVAELANRLTVSSADISLRGATPVLFRNSSLGCPGPGENSTGGQSRGSVAYFSVGDDLYRAHISDSGRFRLCDLVDLDVIPELDR